MEETVFQPLFGSKVPSGEDEQSFTQEVLNDYYICCVSREASILARKEVLTGKGKFGITGDGKELAQVALAKAVKKGDWRAGYYRDQTLMFALGEASIEDYFAQLYSDVANDPFSSGRQMMTHFASPTIDSEGNWLDHTERFNSSADVSCTAGQMGRAVGLALASKKYRELAELEQASFSNNGKEVVICTIGDGSTSQGVFWEAVNASCVKGIPVAFCVWDDGYAISVPKKYQTTKGSISQAMEGLLIDDKHSSGMRIYVAKAWDYVALCEMFSVGVEKIRKSQIPALFHVEDMTQPQGHSTSGSHERYKPADRILWEKEMDCILAFEAWIVHHKLATLDDLVALRRQAKDYARSCKQTAWKRFIKPVLEDRDYLQGIIAPLSANIPQLELYNGTLSRMIHPTSSELISLARQAYYRASTLGYKSEIRQLVEFIEDQTRIQQNNYGTHLFAENDHSALEVVPVPPEYGAEEKILNGYQVLSQYFERAFSKYPNLLAFGEDVGRLGDVNQGMKGLQEKYGEARIFDTGLREWTIIGQAIGLAQRGFRPIAEIQYLDYIVYGLAPLMDDLATLRYRTRGIQMAPAIIRTRGHRLEGIWHTGSPMSMLLNSLRGIYILTPRNFVQAVGMYETILRSNDPCIMIECLNGYRHKEVVPENVGEFTVALGMPEIIESGEDVTLVTYGACVRIAANALSILNEMGISVELIDVQTLLPFDRDDVILRSLKKTNRILFMDEDVPGGATAYMLQEVIENRGGFDYLELPPRTLTGKEHRTPYGSDGDYFAKPNREDVVEMVYKIMRESDPARFPVLSLS